MAQPLRLSDLYNLSETEKSLRLRELVHQSRQPLNGEVAELDRQIAEFEIRYEMASDTMREKFNRHELRETAEIGHWLILLDLRDRLAAKA